MPESPVFQLEGIWARLMKTLGGKHATSHASRIEQGQLVLKALRSMMGGR